MTSLRHGQSKCADTGRPSPEYDAWTAMKQRCLNPNSKAYPDYGGRGITVCDRWLTFENFYADMGEKPEPKSRYSIERIDNDGNYEPGNCKWATWPEQAQNRRPPPRRPEGVALNLRGVDDETYERLRVAAFHQRTSVPQVARDWLDKFRPVAEPPVTSAALPGRQTGENER